MRLPNVETLIFGYENRRSFDEMMSLKMDNDYKKKQWYSYTYIFT